MNRNHDRKIGLGALAVAVTVALGLHAPVRAQEPEPTQLDALLGQLHQTDAKAWQARAAAMQAAAKAAREFASTMRTQAAAKDKAAAVEVEQGKRLLAEVDKLARLRAALTQITFRDPAGQSKAKGGEQGQLEVALAGLQELSAKAWDARTSAMQSKAKAHDKQAQDLLVVGRSLLSKATAKEAEAKALDAELEKLEQLRKLVASLAPDVLALAAPTKTVAEATAKPVAKPAKKPAAESAPPKAAPPKATADPGKVQAAADNEANLITYEEHVFPIFEAHCLDCHDSSDPSSGLDLSSHATTLQGGSSGRTLRPGNPDESRLYLLVAHKEKPEMPKGEEKLANEKIETIRTWIAQGAPKDSAQAKSKAAARVVASRKAAAEAAAREATKLEVQAVMPGKLAAVQKSYPPRPGVMRAIAAAPAAPLLAVPGNRQVLLLHQDKLRELGVLEFAFGQVETLSFSADGTALLAAGGIAADGGGAVLYDVQTGSERGRFGKQRDVVMAAAVSPRADLVAIGGTRKNLEVFRADDGQPLWQQKHDDWVTATTFSSDGKLLASADRQGSVQVREAYNGREVHTFKVGEGLIGDLAFSPSSAMLAVVCADHAVSLYRLSDGRRLFRNTAHGDQALCLTWQSETHLLSSGGDGRILRWRTNGGREAELPRIGEWVYGLAVSADGQRAFAADWQGRLTSIDCKTRKVLGQLAPLAVSQ